MGTRSRSGTDRHRTARPPYAVVAGIGTLLLLGVAVSAARVVGDQSSTRAARPAPTATATPNPGPRTLTAPIPDASAEDASEPRIVLYGDSLSSESQGYFAEYLIRNGVTDVQTRTFGGTALCDYLGAMRQDAAVLHPTTVVIEFSGNAFTPCMRNADGTLPTGDEWFARYRDAAIEALRIFAPSGTHVYFVGTPLNRRAEETRDPNANLLNRLYASLSTLGLSTYVDAGAAVLDHGHWTETLPCLADEPCEGPTDTSGIPTNVVRAPDGGHFCPGAPDAVRGVTGACPVWSSGAFRFGSAMAAPVVRAVSAERQ
jgi:hypothetical protein